MKSRLRHHGKKSERFQRHGLAACIRPRDNEHRIFAAEANRNGHNILCGNKRVTRVYQRRLALFSYHGFPCIHVERKLCAAENKRKKCYVVVIQPKLTRKSGERRGQIVKDSLNFVRLGCLKLSELVIRVNDCDRLYKQRRAGSRSVVDKTSNLAAVLSLYRNNITTVSLSNNILLKIL